MYCTKILLPWELQMTKSNRPSTLYLIIIALCVCAGSYWVSKHPIDDQTSMDDIELSPNDVVGHYLRGERRLQHDNNFAAISDYNTVIRLNPKYIDAYYGRGQANYNLGAYRAAVTDFDTVIRLNPKHVDAYIKRGWAKKDIRVGGRFNTMGDQNHWEGKSMAEVGSLLRAEQYRVAILDFDQAVRLDSNNTDAYLRRGIIKYDLSEYLAAMSDFDTVIRINPDYAVAYYYRGLARQKFVSKNKGFTNELNLEAELDWQTALKIAKQKENDALEKEVESMLSGMWRRK